MRCSCAQDTGAPARALVEKYGGVQAILGDESKRVELIGLLDPAAQLHAHLARQVLAALEDVDGMHRVIKFAPL